MRITLALLMVVLILPALSFAENTNATNTTCAGTTCVASQVPCPDGSIASCLNTCSNNVCSQCAPSCEARMNLTSICAATKPCADSSLSHCTYLQGECICTSCPLILVVVNQSNVCPANCQCDSTGKVISCSILGCQAGCTCDPSGRIISCSGSTCQSNCQCDSTGRIISCITTCPSNCECDPTGRVIECKKQNCPLFVSPGPDFCKDGKIISGGTDVNGCQMPPKCSYNPTNMVCCEIYGFGTMMDKVDVHYEMVPAEKCVISGTASCQAGCTCDSTGKVISCSIPKACDYAAPPQDCSYVNGTNYNSTTGCGMILNCPTTAPTTSTTSGGTTTVPTSASGGGGASASSGGVAAPVSILQNFVGGGRNIVDNSYCQGTAVCAALYAPVCGKDGKTYSNACEAKNAGVQIYYNAPCGRKSDTCGNGKCEEGEEQYCSQDCVGAIGVCPSLSDTQINEKVSRCEEQNGTVQKQEDVNGCLNILCKVKAVQNCQKDAPSELFKKCGEKGGSVAIKRDDGGCIVIADCIQRGDDTQITTQPPAKVLETTDIINLAFKMEQLAIDLDKLAKNANNIADYYKSTGSSEEGKYRRVATMFRAGIDKVTEVKAKLRNKIDSLNIDDMAQIREDVRYIKDVMLKDIVYVMLGSGKDLTELKDCASDTKCLEKAVRICSPAVAKADNMEINVTGLNNNVCVIRGAMIKDGETLAMTCRLEKYAFGLKNAEQFFSSCEGSLKDYIIKNMVTTTQTVEKAVQSVSTAKNQFPPPEGGQDGCKTMKECLVYCDNNYDACTMWFKEHPQYGNTPPRNDLKPTIEMIDKIEKGKGPGGCTKTDECVAYCENPSHYDECLKFIKVAKVMAQTSGGTVPSLPLLMVEQKILAQSKTVQTETTISKPVQSPQPTIQSVPQLVTEQVPAS